MRGRFHPADGQLYCCGMFAWAGNQTQPGGFYRVRYTGKPVVPAGRAEGDGGRHGADLHRPARPERGGPEELRGQDLGLKRTENYGSKHIDEHKLSVAEGGRLPDGKTVPLDIAGPRTDLVHGDQVPLKGADGRAVRGTIHNTIHALDKPAGPRPVKAFLPAARRPPTRIPRRPTQKRVF